MKKTAFSFGLVLLFVSTSFAQWQWLNPQPSGHTCSKIIFTDSVRGFILYSNGDFVTTVDQGTTWSFQQNFPGAAMMDMKDSTAIVTGFGVVYISGNNGKTWQTKATGSTDQFTMVDIVSRDTIFLASTNGKVLRSDDRGNTWKIFNCGMQIGCIEFINSKVGFAGGTAYHILQTDDGGATWQKNVSVNWFPSNARVIKFIDINTGFIFRDHSDLLSTSDGGKTWRVLSIPDDIYSFSFVDKMTGFACGEHGATYKTLDGGVTWNWISMTGRIADYHLHSTYFVNSTTGFTVGVRGRILKTTDAGLTWSTYSPTYGDIRDISVPSPGIAYAVGFGEIHKTVDTGKSWQKLGLTLPPNSSSAYFAFYESHFFNADTGIVTAGDPSRVYKTYDGGLNWKSIKIDFYSIQQPTCLQFLNKDVAYLATNNYSSAVIFKTKDAGETWSRAWTAQYMGEIFHKIYFLDEKTGFASNYDKFYKTEDSAKTWTMLWDEEQISSIQFINSTTGFVTGENAMLKKTVDGGKTWKAVPVADRYYDDIYNIKFLDDKVGYLSAEAGAIYKTVDGGETWRPSGKGSYHSIKAIDFGPDSTVYIAGQWGSILRSAISEYRIDSAKMRIAGCNAEFSTWITAVSSSIDSLQYEYGVGAFDHVVPASPTTFNNRQQLVTASISGLPASTFYKVRLKFFYQGQFRFGPEYTLRTLDSPSKPSINPSGNVSICQGDSIILTSSANSGNQWHLNGVALPLATLQALTVKTPGKYQLVRTVGCYSSDTASTEVTVNVIPGKPTITASGNMLVSSADNGNQWYLDGVQLAGATGKQHVADKNGLYTVQVTANSCPGSYSEPFNFFTSPNNVSIYPNPVKGDLTVRNSMGEKMSIQIIDEKGNIIYSEDTSGSSHIIDMSFCTRGKYIVRVKLLGTGETSSRIVIKI